MFSYVIETVVMPITVLVGLLGNSLSICVLRQREIQVTDEELAHFAAIVAVPAYVKEAPIEQPSSSRNP